MASARTFTLEKVDATDALMTSEPAPTEPTVYGAEDFDGAFAEECGTFHAARTVTITLSAGDWNDAETVEIEGYFGDRDGKPARQFVDVELPAHVDEPTTLRPTQPFYFPPGVTITFPMQPAGGTFTLGVGDAVAPEGFAFDDVRASADGRVSVVYDDEHDDSIEMLRGERLGVRVVAVRAEGTEYGVTLFVPAIGTVEERTQSVDAPGDPHERDRVL
ncbi:MAG TPA: hypothetical protein VFQ35_09645 [Polyangiaceae bacterium]|nr:hypothetical protein [Polyangiaceae bacterium]